MLRMDGQENGKVENLMVLTILITVEELYWSGLIKATKVTGRPEPRSLLQTTRLETQKSPSRENGNTKLFVQ